MKPLSADEMIRVQDAMRKHGAAHAWTVLGLDADEMQARWKLTKKRLTQRRYQQSAKGKAVAARYAKTEKGKAARNRYNQSAKHRAANRRYLHTPRGQEVNAVLNERRIFVGETYQGRAQTTEQAAVIRTHIKERIRAFITRQSQRTAMEVHPSDAVPHQAGTGAHGVGRDRTLSRNRGDESRETSRGLADRRV